MTIKPYLRKVLKPYNKGVYLETGLGPGESSKLALDLNFKKVISIEINKKSILYVKTKLNNFIKKKKLLLVHGDSSKKLGKIVKKYKNISVFFLDAHDGNYSNNAPLEKELKIIKKNYNNQLIIIDDFANIKFSNYNHKYYWGKKNDYQRILLTLKKDFKCETTEIYYGSLFAMSSILVNKKVPQNLMMLFKNTEGQIHYFLKPLMLNSRILIRKFLKLILSKTLYNLIRKKYNSFHHYLIKS